MFKRLFELFTSVKTTIFAGIFLAISLIFMLTKINFFIDPAWVTVIICGYPLLYLAIWQIIYENGINKISSALLITIAMLACIWLSFRGDGHENIFAAGEVAFIMAIGAILEEKTVERAQKGIKSLISLVPSYGRIILNNKVNMVAIKYIKVGDILRVLPGETIPIDGEIISGNTSIDQSIITGESLPIDKTIGDNVFCGTINRFGSIDIKATKVGEDSSLQRLIKLVQEAAENKAPMQRIVDKWAAWLVPIALIIAFVTYLITQDITRAVTVLVVFCPCALVLATPTSIMAAIGQATKHGIIIKSGNALEQMGKIDTIAFDKTGTLTMGKLVVSDIVSFDKDISENELLMLAATAESHSEHPLGKAIVAFAKNKGLAIGSVDSFKMIPGKGICAKISDVNIKCGNATWLKEGDTFFSDRVNATLKKFNMQGKATILVADERRIKGVIALSDTLRPSAASLVHELEQTHTKIVLLTGDNSLTASYFAKQVGIKSIYAELLPAQKVEKIQELQSTGHSVCMIGDGVNDAPALKTANVGVAMGSMGSDIAIDSADISLIGDDIGKIPYLKKLSTATVQLIKFNISLSMLINLVAIILSTLSLLNPITGALVHNVGSVLVVLNAALLYERKFM